MRKTICLLFSSFLCHFAFTQSKPEIVLKKLDDNYPTEKVFIQYDKPFYMAGENMRFKAYVFTGYSLTDISTNLYIELYNNEKKLLKKSIIPLINGTGEGSLFLESDIPENVYYIRAYTHWMLNFSNGSDYIQGFSVYNPGSSEKLIPKPVHWVANAFPESGILLAGVENKIAIRLFSKSNLPASWKATVFDETNNRTLETISSYNSEIGDFTIIPSESTSYRVNVTDNLGNTQNIILPKAKLAGALIKVSQEDSMIICNLEFKNLPSPHSNYLFIGSMNNQLAYKAYLKRTDTIITARIPVKRLMPGILRLTLFNENEQLVSERLTFVHSLKSEKSIIDLDTFSTTKRALNYWHFAIDSNSLHSYSASVSDINMPSQKESLLSALWLSNDITWPVNEPSWYFSEINNQRKEALDALLITEKWKWFKWDELLNNHFPYIEYQPDYYLSYTGTVFLGKKMQLNRSVNLVYQLPDSSLNFQQVSTDSSGAFTIDGAMFEDSVTVFYKLDSKKNISKKIKIYFEPNNKFVIMNSALPSFNYFLVPRREKDSLPALVHNNYNAFQTQLNINNRYKQMKEIIIRTKKKNARAALNKKLSSGMFRSINEDVFDFVNDKQDLRGTSNIVQWLNGRVAGLNISNVNGQVMSMIRGKVAKLYVDEALATIQWVRTLPVTDIAMVKIQRSFSGTSATILIYTKKGEYNNAGNPFMSLPYYTIKGYNTLPPLNFVNYDDNFYQQIEEDTRQQLFWSSAIGNDSNSKATIKFYNSDICRQFKLTILGFTSDRKPVYEEYIIPSRD